MKQIFVVYETDPWHSTSHRECAGVFTSKWAAVNAIVKNHRIELDEDSAKNWSLPIRHKAMKPTMTLRYGISMNGI